MSHQLKYFVGMDFLLRLSGFVFDDCFIAYVYQLTGRSSDIGFISLATFIPSLLVTLYSGYYLKMECTCDFARDADGTCRFIFGCGFSCSFQSWYFFLWQRFIVYSIRFHLLQKCLVMLSWSMKRSGQYLASKCCLPIFVLSWGLHWAAFWPVSYLLLEQWWFWWWPMFFCYLGFKSDQWIGTKIFQTIDSENDLESNSDISKKFGFMDCYRYLKHFLGFFLWWFHIVWLQWF